MVERAEDLAEILQEAIHLAQSGRPGPVLVDIPKDIQLAQVSYHPWLAQDDALPNLSAEQVSKANQLLADAKQPVAYIGGGVQMADAQTQLMAFLNQSSMPL